MIATVKLRPQDVQIFFCIAKHMFSGLRLVRFNVSSAATERLFKCSCWCKLNTRSFRMPVYGMYKEEEKIDNI